MPAAEQAVGPRYPTSSDSAPGPLAPGSCGTLGPPGMPGTSLSSNRGPCKRSGEPSSPLVTATPTSTGADYPRYSHRKPAQAAASTTARGASRHSGGHVPNQGAWRVLSRSGSPAEVLGRDGVEELP